VVYGQYQRPAIDAYYEVEPGFQRQLFVGVLQHLEPASALEYLLILRFAIQAGDEPVKNAEHCGSAMAICKGLLRDDEEKSQSGKTARRVGSDK
jgi:hypothetical protein